MDAQPRDATENTAANAAHYPLAEPLILQLTVDGVKLEQVGAGLDGRGLVDVHQLQLGARVKRDAEGQAACEG